MAGIDEAISDVAGWRNVESFSTALKVGETINLITSSLNRYGQIIVSGETREEIDSRLDEYEDKIKRMIILR